MSVGKDSRFHDPFQKLFFKVLTIPFPATWEGDHDVDEKEQQSLKVLRTILSKHSETIVAFIGEPLVQGAAGMKMARPLYFQHLVDCLRDAGVFIIFDEVMTGFGRTGANFALDIIKRSPDILCLSKGLTGGFLPLALTVTTEKIYEAFLGDHFSQAFAHGHSYTANPLGCAVALASLKLLKEKTTQEKIQGFEADHRQLFQHYLQGHVSSPRFQGTIMAFDIKGKKEDLLNLRQRALDKGLVIRPLGNTVYFLPPYCLSYDDLERAYRDLFCILSDMGLV